MAFISRFCFTVLFTAKIAIVNAQVVDFSANQQPTRLLDIKGSANGVYANVLQPLKNGAKDAGLALRYYWNNKQASAAVKRYLLKTTPYLKGGGLFGVLASLGLTYYLNKDNGDVFVDEVNGVHYKIKELPPSLFSKKASYTGTNLGGYNSLDEIGKALLNRYGASYYNYKQDKSKTPFVFDYHSLYSGSTFLAAYDFDLFDSKGKRMLTYQVIKVTQTCPSGRYSSDINCSDELPVTNKPLTTQELVDLVPDEYQIPDSALKDVYPYFGTPSSVEIVEQPKSFSDVQKLDDGSVKQVDVLPKYSISADLNGSFGLVDNSSIRERIYQNGALISDKTSQNNAVASIAIDKDLNDDNDDKRSIVLPSSSSEVDKSSDTVNLSNLNQSSLALSNNPATLPNTNKPFSFCDTFSVVCSFFSWVQETPNLEEPKIEPVKDYKVNERKVDINFGRPHCPKPVELNLAIFGKHFIDFDFICRLATYISYFLISAAYIVSIRINLGIIK